MFMKIKNKLSELSQSAFRYVRHNLALVIAAAVLIVILGTIIISTGLAAPATSWITTPSTNCITQGTGNTMVEVNGYVYVLAGNSTDFRKYNPATGQCDTSALAPFPTTANYGTSLEKIDNNTIMALAGNGSSYTYFYNIPNNQWIFYNAALANEDANKPIIAAPPIAESDGNSIVSVGNEIYMLSGLGTSFMKYTPAANSWTSLTGYPTTAAKGAALAYYAAGNYIYAISGNNSKTAYRYNISTPGWTQLGDLPANVNAGGALTIVGNTLYAFGGNNSKNFYSYDLTQSTPGAWVNLTTTHAAPALVYGGGAMTAIGTNIYAFQGNDTKAFWKYDTAGQTWSALTDAPDRIAGSGSLTTDGTYVYATPGHGALEYWRYDPSGNAWTAMANPPLGTGGIGYSALNNISDARGGIAYIANGPSGSGEIYLSPGTGMQASSCTNPSCIGSLFRYKISANAWPTYWVRNTPASINYGGSLVYPGTGDFVYALRGAATNFWKYKLSAGIWIPWNIGKLNATDTISQNVDCGPGTTVCNETQSYGNSLTIAGGKIYSIVSGGIVAAFDPATNYWRELTQAPVSIAGSTDAAIIKYDDNTLYVAGYNIGFMKYDIANETWFGFPIGKTTDGKPFSQLGPANGTSSGGTTLNQGKGNTITEANGKFYVIPGGASYGYFYEFDPAINKWTKLTDTPGTPSSGTAMVTVGNFIYLIHGSGYNSIYKYDIINNSWSSSLGGSAPNYFGSGAALANPAGGNFIYAFRGRNSSAGPTNEFYRFNISTPGWTNLSATMPTPNPVQAGGAMVALNATDIYAMAGNGSRNFWKFTVTNSPTAGDGTWTDLTATDPLPDTVWSGGALTTDGTYIYVLKGNNTATMWRYDPAATSGSRWTTLQNAPVTIGTGGSSSITVNTVTDNEGGMAYSPTLGDIYMVPGNGYENFSQNSGNGPGLIYRYQLPASSGPSADDYTWPYFARTETLPATAGQGISLTYPGSGNYIYALQGSNANFWSYDVTTNQWHSIYRSKKDDGTALSQNTTAANQGSGNSVAEVDGKLYVLAGNATGSTNTFQKFDPAANTWTNLAATPNTINYGAAIVKKDSNTLYVFRGGNTSDFWKYDIPSNSWSGFPLAKKDDGTILSQGNYNQGYGNSIIKVNNPTGGQPEFYVLDGNSTSNFEKFNPSTNTWTVLAPTTSISYGAAMAAVGSDIYAFAGNSSNSFYKYNIPSNTWTSLALAPSYIYYGGSLVNPGTGNLYALAGNGTSFMIYNIANNRWNNTTDIPTHTAMAAAPATVNGGGALTYIGGNIYALGGNNTTNFWKYNIANNRWNNAGDAPENGTPDVFPATVTAGGSLTTDGTYIYGTRGYLTPNVWKYNPAATAGSRWSAISSAPVNIGSTSTSDSKGGITYCDNCGTGEIWMVSGYGVNNYSTTTATNTGSIYRYNLASNSWIYNAKTTAAPGSVTYGGSLTYPGAGDLIYAFQGGSTAFWAYNTATNAWATLTAAPTTAGSGAALTSFLNGANYDIFALMGGNTKVFRTYRITDTATGAGAWTTFDPTDITSTANVQSGGSLTNDGANIYAAVGGGTSEILRYNVSGNSWSTTAPVSGNLTLPTSAGSAALNIGNSSTSDAKGGIVFVANGAGTTDDELYLVTGTGTIGSTVNTNALPGRGLIFRYPFGGTNAGTWPLSYSLPAAAPASIGTGGDLVSTGANDIFALQGGSNTAFWRYNIPNNRWNTAADDPSTAHNVATPAPAPSAVSTGGALTWDGANTIFATKGGANTTFWQYNIPNNRWNAAADKDFGGGNGTPAVTPVKVGYNSYGGGIAYQDPDGTPASGDETVWMQPGNGASGITDATAGAGAGLLYRYDTTTNTWPYYSEAADNASFSTFYGGSDLTATNDGTAIFALDSYSTTAATLWKYVISPEPGTWTQMASAPASFGIGGSLTSVGTDNTALYATRGGLTSTIFKYNFNFSTCDGTGANPGTGSTACNYWTTPTNFAFPTGFGATGFGTSGSSDTGDMIYSPSTLKLFATPGNDTATPFSIYSLTLGTRVVPTPTTTPVVNTNFDVLIEAVNKDGTPVTVTQNTNVALTLKTGTGTLSGTLTGTIPNGLSQVTISGVRYSTYESGVVITAAATSGDTLTATDSAAFTVNPPPPTIANISMSSGITSGGTGVTINGTNFFATPRVTFGGKDSEQVTWISPTQVIAIAPPHAAGTVDVTYINPSTQSITSANAFTYGSGLTVTGVTTNTGTTGGGTLVTISGTGFAPNYYKRSVTITNGGSTLTNYQTSFTLDTTTLIANGKMRADCGDIRVWNSTETAILPFYVENCNSATTKIWTKIPSITAGANTLYVTYGNPNLAPASNGDAVFDFFDDFNGTTVDTTKWTGDTNNFNQSQGILRPIKDTNTGSANAYRLQTVRNFTCDGTNGTLPCVMETKHYTRSATTSSSSIYYMIGGFKEDMITTNNIGYMQAINGGTDYYYSANGTQGSTSIGNVIPDNTWLIAKFAANGTTVNISAQDYSNYLLGNSTYRHGSLAVASNGINNEKIALGERYDNSTGYNYDADWDWVRVRQYAATEPTSVTNNDETGGSSQVTFAGTPATNIKQVSDTAITAYTPAHAAGAADVAVTNYDSTTGTLSSGFTYGAIALTGISPAYGATGGGTTATITGSNFAEGGYRRPITISNPAASALTNYQVNFTLDTAALVSGGKMKSDCGDIRFKDSDQTTALNNYWIEYGCNTTATSVWVLVPNIPAGGKTVWMTYGNANLTTTGNSANVFSAFIPANIRMWLKADAGITIASAANVSGWTDQSGNGNTVSAASNYPQLVANAFNGKPVIRFNGTNNYLTKTGLSANMPTGTANRSAFMAATYRNNSYAGVSYGSTASNGNFGMINYSGYPSVSYTAVSSTYYMSNYSVFNTPLFLHEAVLNGSTLYQYRNGILGLTSTGTSFSTGTTQIDVGRGLASSSYGDMDIAEYLLFNDNLSDADRQSVERYFGIKYGIMGNNPSATAGAETGATGSLNVIFAGAAPATFSLTDSAHITATTASHAAGAVDVTVTNPNAESASLTGGFTYLAPPTLTSVNPATAVNNATIPVTINGTNFYTGTPIPTVKLTRATFADINCTGVSVSSSSQLTCNLPLTGAAPGQWNVVFTNPDAQSTTLTNGFTITYPAPTLTSVTPNSGAPEGDESVTLTGTNFQTGRYIRPVTIDNTSGSTQTDYQVRFTIDTQSLITASEMRSDCGDLRVKDDNRITDIPYYLESGCNTATTVIWTKIPSIPTGTPGKTIYVTYGDNALTSASNGDNVFIFFDDFPTATIDAAKWTTQAGSPAFTAPHWTTFTSPAYNGNYSSGNSAMGSTSYLFRNITTKGITVPSGSSAIIDFYWSVDANYYSKLYYCFSNDGTTVPGCTRSSSYISEIGGVTAWTREKTIVGASTLAAGAHRIKFAYEKEYSTSGADTSWIDAVKVRKIAYTGSTISETVSDGTVGAESPFAPIVEFCTAGTSTCTTATSTTITSATELGTITPAHTAGMTDVKVTNPDGQSYTLSNGYNYNVPFPIITSVVPNFGRVSGNDLITINGSNFQNGATVKFGLTNATAVTFINANTIQVHTPVHAGGLVDISVTNPAPDSTTGTAANGFEYINAADDNNTILSVISTGSSPNTVVADGTDSGIINVKLNDSDNAPVKGKAVTVAKIAGTGTPVITPVNCQPTDVGIWTPGSTNTAGEACFNVSGAIKADHYVFTATDVTDSLPVFTNQASIEFTGPTAATSTASSSPNHALANGSDYVTLTITLRDGSGNLFPNRTISAARATGPGWPSFNAINCTTGDILGTLNIATTNSLGRACYHVTSYSSGTFSLQGHNGTEGFDVTQWSVVIFGSGPVLGNGGTPIANAKNDGSTYYTPSFTKTVKTSDDNYITIWRDTRTNPTNLYAQKFSGTDGQAQWTPATGVLVYDAAANGQPAGVGPYDPNIVPSETGAIITWIAPQHGGLLARRINDDGSFDSNWTSPYKVVESSPQFGAYGTSGDETNSYSVSEDGAGGVYFLYNITDGSTYPYWNITGHHLTIDGQISAPSTEWSWPASFTPSWWESYYTCSGTPNGDITVSPSGIPIFSYSIIQHAPCGLSDSRKMKYVIAMDAHGTQARLNSNNYIPETGGTPTPSNCGDYESVNAARIAASTDGGIFALYIDDCLPQINDTQIYLRYIYPYAETGQTHAHITIQLPPEGGGLGACCSVGNQAAIDLVAGTDNDVFVAYRPDQTSPTSDNDFRIKRFKRTGPDTLTLIWSKTIPANQIDGNGFQLLKDSSGNPIVVWNSTTPTQANSQLKAVKFDAVTGDPMSGWNQYGNVIDTDLAILNQKGSQQSTSVLRSIVPFGTDGFAVAGLNYNYGPYSYPWTANIDNSIQAFDNTGNKQWNDETDVEISPGVDALAATEKTQKNQQIVNVGNGNFVVGWEDDAQIEPYAGNYYHGTFYPVAEKFNAKGERMWNPDFPGRGKVLIAGDASSATTNNTNLNIAADETTNAKNGGMLSAWINANTSGYAVFVQKIDANGNRSTTWNYNGSSGYGRSIASYTTAYPQTKPQIISDGNGGAFVSWTGSALNTLNGGLFLTRINDSDGNISSSWGGSAKHNITGDPAFVRNNEKLLYDRTNGYVYAITQTRCEASPNRKSISINRWNAANGSYSTGAQIGSSTCPGTGASYDFGDAILDSNGDVIITYRNDDTQQIYAQKLDNISNLPKQWGSDGIKISTSANNNQNPAMAKDNANGTIIAWERYNAGNTASDIVAQRINANGNMLWNETPLTSQTTAILKQNPRIVADEGPAGFPANGALLAWDEGTSNKNIRVQHLINGVAQWGQYGSQITNDSGNILNESPVIASDGLGGLFAAWTKPGDPTDVYGQYFVEGNHSYNSTLTADATTPKANGIETGYLIATLLDTNDNPVTGRTITAGVIKGNPSAVIITPYVDSLHCQGGIAGITNSNGQACFTVNSTEEGQFTFTATDTTEADNHNVINQTADITFIPTPSATLSTFEAFPTTLTANNANEGYLIARVLNAGGKPIPNATVTISQTAGDTTTVRPASQTTDVNGRAEFYVKSENVTLATYRANINGETDIAQEPQINFLAPPQITGINPNKGPVTGGTAVTISGTNLTPLTYKRSIQINNSGSGTELNNYQVKFTLDTATLIGTGEMRSDCGDIRIINAVDSTNLPYWFDPAECNATATQIWTKIPHLTGGADNYIYVTYGNPNLPAIDEQTRGKEVFDFYDTFNANDFGGANSVWDRTDATGVYTDFPGSGIAPYVDTANSRAELNHNNLIQTRDYVAPFGTSLEAKTMGNSTDGAIGMIGFNALPATSGINRDDYTAAMVFNGAQLKVCNATYCSNYGPAIWNYLDANTWYINQLQTFNIDPSTNHAIAAIFSTDGTPFNSTLQDVSGTVYPSGKITLGGYFPAGAEDSVTYVDWVRARQQINNEPSTTVSANETPSVYFLDDAATYNQLNNVNFVNETTITAETPPHNGETVDVGVKYSLADSAELPNGYEYIPPPSITSIYLPTGFTGSTVHVRITGTAFSSNSESKISKGGSDIACTEPIITPTSIDCTINLTGAETGPWSVTVSNSQTLTSTLTDGFMVEEGPSAALSTFTASPTSIPADDATTSTLTATLLNSTGTPVTSQHINVIKTTGNNTPTIRVATCDNGGNAGLTNNSGEACFTASSAVRGTDTFTAIATTTEQNRTIENAHDPVSGTIIAESNDNGTNGVEVTYTLPFTINIYGTSTNKIYICSKGFISTASTGSYCTDNAGTPPPETSAVFIMPYLNQNISTSSTAPYDAENGIYASNTAEQTTIRYKGNATNGGTNSGSIAFSVVINNDSSIEFHYGDVTDSSNYAHNDDIRYGIGNNVLVGLFDGQTGLTDYSTDLINNAPGSELTNKQILYSFTRTPITQTASVNFTCVTGPNQQCLEVSIGGGGGGTNPQGPLTIDAPASFSLGTAIGGAQRFSKEDASYTLNANDIVTVSDLRNDGGFNLQMQVDASGFTTGNGKYIPLQNFHAVTTAAGTGGTAVDGVEYTGTATAPQNIVAPINANVNSAGDALLTPGTFTSCGVTLGTGGTFTTPGTPTPIDLMIGGVDTSGRNGSFKQNVNYYLDVPVGQPNGNYNVTITFDLLDSATPPPAQPPACTP
jgi:N-acetylneuraminic acid mutarotase